MPSSTILRRTLPTAIPRARSVRAGVRRASGSDHLEWHRNVRRLKRGVVNVVDVDVLGTIVPKAKIGLVSVHDTQGRNAQIPQSPSRGYDRGHVPVRPGRLRRPCGSRHPRCSKTSSVKMSAA